MWSFFGGVPVEGTWTTTTDAALNMAPPFQRRIVELQAAPDAVQQHGIRAITVRVFYTLAGVEKSKTVTLNAAKNQLSEKIEFMLPGDSVDYAYDMTWQLTGNRTRSSGRQTASSERAVRRRSAGAVRETIMQTIRTLATRVVLAGLVSALAAPAAAQTKIVFLFVAPTATMTANFNVAQIRGGGGFSANYRSVEIIAATLPAVRRIAPANMMRTFDELQPGRPLRAKFDRMLLLSQGAVTEIRVTLVDDRTGVTDAPGWSTKPDGALSFVWPGAGNAPVAGSGHIGAIVVGEHWAAVDVNDMAKGWPFFEMVILHEMLHSQCTGLSTKWGNTAITYGLDNNHPIAEILGAQDKAFEEGLGTFYGFAHFNPTGMTWTSTFFANAGNDRYSFDDGSIAASWMDLRQAATHSQLVTPIPRPVATAQPARPAYTRYFAPWLRVPGKYILFNEWTTTGFSLYFWSNTNGDRTQAFTMMEEMSKRIAPEVRRRNLAFASNHLALQLEAFAKTPAGQAKATAGTLTSSMFPVALVDLLTHYGMTEDELKLEYTRNNLDPKSQAITEYWKHRAAVKALVDADIKASPIRFDQAVAAIHRYFQAKATILVQP